MTAMRVVPRDQAHRDVEDAIDHYACEAGSDIALGFVEALEAAYRGLAEHPGIGSPRYAHEACRLCDSVGSPAFRGSFSPPSATIISKYGARSEEQPPALP